MSDDHRHSARLQAVAKGTSQLGRYAVKWRVQGHRQILADFSVPIRFAKIPGTPFSGTIGRRLAIKARTTQDDHAQSHA
jgi:hypothetical protein